MKDVPPTARKWYKIFCVSFPDSKDIRSLEKFYVFVARLLQNQKKDRDRYWLKENLEKDTKLSKNEVEEFCDIFDHLRNSKKALRSRFVELNEIPDFLQR